MRFGRYPRPTRTMSTSERNSSTRKWRHCTLLHSGWPSLFLFSNVQFILVSRLKAPTTKAQTKVLSQAACLPPSSTSETARTRGARWATVLRHRGLLSPRNSKWKSRAQVVRELPQSPQGTTASTTPPFRRVVCVINALVPQGRLRHQRPRSAGSTA